MRAIPAGLMVGGCVGLMLGMAANAQVPKRPVAARPPIPVTAPVMAPAKDPLAAKAIFQTVMTELDQGGDVLVVMNVEGAFQEMMDLIAKIVSAAPSDDPETAQIKVTIARLKVYLKKNGFFAATGVGFSSVPSANGMSTVKLFVSRDAAAAALPLWRTVTGGEPRKQVTADFLPTDTALFRIVDVIPSELLQMVKSGVAEVGPPGSPAAFSNAMAGASAALGMSIENLINSMGDEMFVSLRLSSQSKVVIPVPSGEKLEVPEPSLLVGCKVKDDSALKLISTLLTKNEIPVVESKVGSTVLMTVNGLPPLPVPFQPTFAMHGGCLLIGSTPKTVADAIEAFDKKNGFTAGPEFKNAFKDLPLANNGMAFMSPTVFQTISAIQSRLANAGGRRSPQSDVFQSMFSDMLIGAGREPMAFVTVNKKNGVLMQGTMPGAGSKMVAALTLAPAASVGMLAAIAVPSFMKARTNAGKSACMNNLRLIDAAKENYAIDHGGTNGMALTWDNVAVYMKDVTNRCSCPSAPAGKRSLNNYRMGRIGEDPKCLVDPSHSLSAPVPAMKR